MRLASAKLSFECERQQNEYSTDEWRGIGAARVGFNPGGDIKSHVYLPFHGG